MDKPIFKGPVPDTETQYVGVPICHEDGSIGLHIAWLDGTSAADIALEISSYGADEAPLDDDGEAWHWIDSGVSITGPAGTAAAAEAVMLENVRMRRARLKIEATANCQFEIWSVKR